MVDLNAVLTDDKEATKRAPPASSRGMKCQGARPPAQLRALAETSTTFTTCSNFAAVSARAIGGAQRRVSRFAAGLRNTAAAVFNVAARRSQRSSVARSVQAST